MEDKTDKIVIEGPMEEVERVRIALLTNVDKLLSELTFADVIVDPKYHKHIIGIPKFSPCLFLQSINHLVNNIG